MLDEIKKIIDNKIREIGFSYFDPENLTVKEQLVVNSFEYDTFPQWDVRYYPKSKTDEPMSFKLKISLNNRFEDMAELPKLEDMNNYRFHISLK